MLDNKRVIVYAVGMKPKFCRKGAEKMGQVISAQTAAEMAGVRVETIWKWCRRGLIDAESDGRGTPWRITINETFLKKCKPKSKGGTPQ
jgi:predicted site-specific integrase-resolvase